jgi:hypothetical protein
MTVHAVFGREAADIRREVGADGQETYLEKLGR